MGQIRKRGKKETAKFVVPKVVWKLTEYEVVRGPAGGLQVKQVKPKRKARKKGGA